MKKFVILFLMGLLLSSFSTVSALELKGKFAVSGLGTLALPIGDFAKEEEEGGAAKSGYGFGGNFEYFITDNISIGGSFTYRRFGVKTGDAEEGFGELLEWMFESDLPGVRATSDIDAKYEITSFGVFGKYLFTPSPQVSPYLKFGLGSGKLKTSVDKFSGHLLYQDKRIPYEGSVDLDDISKAYVDIGGGILYQLSENIVLTGEVLFSRLMTDGADQKFDMEMEGRGAGIQVWGTAEWEDKFCDADYMSAFVGLTVLFGGTK